MTNAEVCAIIELISIAYNLLRTFRKKIVHQERSPAKQTVKCNLSDDGHGLLAAERYTNRPSAG